MKTLLSETGAPRINALIRSIFFWISFVLFLFVLSSQSGGFFPPRWERFAYGLMGTLSAGLATFIFLKIEKRSFADIGLNWERSTIKNFIKGIFIGTAIFVLIIIILLRFTELQIEKNSKTFTLSAAFWYLAIIPLALMEEIAFRSYPFLKLNKALGLRLTQLIVAIAFALYHMIGGWSMAGAFLGPGIWALVFGLAAVWSGGIALPTGIHVALNVMQSLLALKPGNFEPVWIIKQKEGISAAALSGIDNIGLITHLLVLAAAVILTEFYIRKKQAQIQDR